LNNNNNNNNKKPTTIRDKRFNDILTTNLDSTINDRYCRTCHLKLVNNPQNRINDKYVYVCPRCNCGAINIHNTEPGERILPVFPTHNSSSPSSKKLITQPENQRLSRSNYFINKNIQKRNEIIVDDDPYLMMLKQNNKIKITNVEYNEPFED
jgi:hypothetical protein